MSDADTTSVGGIGLDLKLNTKDFDYQLKAVKRSTDSWAKKLAGTIASAFAVKKILDFGKSCIELGSDLSEVQNVVDVTFGGMSDKVDAFAKNAATSFGLSETVAKRMSGTYGSMAKAFGFSTDEAYQMSTALTGLAGDVASFYNLNADEAYTKLKSVFTGETESLKDLGVVMTQTALDSYALANGYGKVTAAMTEAEKVSLRYAFVSNQLSLANGDFERTSDGWANQMRILSPRFESIKSTLGQGLINALTPVLQLINRLLGKVAQLAEAFSNLTEQFFGHSDMEESTTAAASGMGATAEAAEATNQSLKKASRYLAAFDVMNKVSSSSETAVTGSTGGTGEAVGSQGINTSPSGEKELSAFERRLQGIKEKAKEVTAFLTSRFSPTVSAAFAKIKAPADRFLQLFTRMASDVRSLGEPLLTWFTGPFCDVIDSSISLAGTVISGFLDTCTSVFDDIWNQAAFPLVSKFVTSWLPTITEVANSALQLAERLFSRFKEIIDTLWTEAVLPVITLITQIIMDLFDDIQNCWDTYGKPITDAALQAIDGIGSNVETLWSSVLKPIVDHLISTVTALWNQHIRPFVQKVLDAFGRLTLTLLNFYNDTLRPLIDLIIAKMGPKIAGFINRIISWIGRLAGDIFDTLGDIVDFIVNVFTGNWEEAWGNLKDIVGDVFNTMVDLVKTPINIIISLINGLISGVCSGINGVAGALNNLKIDVPGWVTDLTGITSFGFDIPKLTTPQIPMLANGGFVKANTPQLAIIGDNRHQGEIVSPEDKLKDMAYQAAVMASGGNATLLQHCIELLETLISLVQDGSDIVLMVDGEELARASANGAVRLKRRYTTTEIKFT